jgi:membrane protease subunit HflK
VPRARGEAEQIEQNAGAYKQEVTARAQGDAQRFLSVLNAYRAAKDVTAERLYLETMEQVLKNANKVLIDKSAGVLPYLPLPGLNQARPQPPAPVPAPPAPPATVARPAR